MAPAKAITKIDQLKPDRRNANRGTVRGAEMIEGSIAELGTGRSILADAGGNVIAGNKTLEAFKRAGKSRIRVVESDGETLIVVRRTDLNLRRDAKAKKLAIADNRTAQVSLDWDPEMLAAISGEVDLSALFSADELASILPAGRPLLGDPDEVPDLPAKPKTKPGTLYVLGDHRLLCGDSTKEADAKKLLAGGHADCVWTDPPYNVAYTGGTKQKLTIMNDAMPDEQFAEFLAAVYANVERSLKAGGAVYVAHADSSGHLFRKAMIDSGLLLKQCLVWVKQTFVMGRQDYHWQHEPILEGVKPPESEEPAGVTWKDHEPVLYGWKPGDAHRWYADRKQTTVLEFDKPAKNAEHPTMKPVALVQYCLENSSKPGDVVLDLFGGSGSTLIACEAIGRKARLMELDPRYCDVIVERWQNLSGGKARIAKA